MSSPTASDFPTLVEGFGYGPLAPAIWHVDPDSRLERRDLGLRSASDGVLVAEHLRTDDQARDISSLVPADSPFAFIFVIDGEVTIEEDGVEPVRLQRYSAATRHGRGRPGRLRFAPGAEIFAIVAPESAATELGVNGNASPAWVVTHERPEAYILGEGPRAYFKYRDLGVSAATGRRIHIHLVEATRSMAGGTGWHHHTMGQIFFVLRGWADLAVRDRPWVRMGPKDAMCLAAGMDHDVPAFSADYLVLEMCVPSDYDTTDVPAPEKS